MEIASLIISLIAIGLWAYTALFKKTPKAPVVNDAAEGVVYVKKQGLKTILTDSEGKEILEI